MPRMAIWYQDFSILRCCSKSFVLVSLIVALIALFVSWLFCMTLMTGTTWILLCLFIWRIADSTRYSNTAFMYLMFIELVEMVQEWCQLFWQWSDGLVNSTLCQPSTLMALLLGLVRNLGLCIWISDDEIIHVFFCKFNQCKIFDKKMLQQPQNKRFYKEHAQRSTMLRICFFWLLRLNGSQLLTIFYCKGINTGEKTNHLGFHCLHCMVMRIFHNQTVNNNRLKNMAPFVGCSARCRNNRLFLMTIYRWVIKGRTHIYQGRWPTAPGAKTCFRLYI